MAKNKKEQVRKRSKPRIPIDYLEAVADRIHSTAPTKEIILNTVKSVWSDGFGRGYLRHLDDAKVFRAAREARIKESFDSIKDQLDDEIHKKPNQ